MQRKMTALVQQWERSTETRARFARRHGVTLATFEYWKRRVRRATAPVPTFAPVTLVADQAAPAPRAIAVVLVSGERLTTGEGVSGELVRAVVAALRVSC